MWELFGTDLFFCRALEFSKIRLEILNHAMPLRCSDGAKQSMAQNTGLLETAGVRTGAKMDSLKLLKE